MPSEQYPNAALGVVLAGGLSRRMGRDKAMLEHHGRSLLRRQVDLLMPVCTRVIVSGDYAGFDCIPDEGGRHGPLGGILSVSGRVPGSSLLVIPVDMPCLGPEHLARLLQCREACHFGGQPLPAYFPDGGLLARALQGIFDSPETGLSVRRLHAALASRALPEADFEALNINTPAQWAEFMQKE